jgi:hypothetical protein
MKTVIRLIIVALIIHGTGRATIVAWRHYKFTDGVQQAAQFASGRSEAELVQQVLEIAAVYQIPLAEDGVAIRRVDNHTFIDASYNTRIEILPRYFYPWRFNVNVDAFTIVPQQAAP